jgi:hypothetical protein
MFFLLVTLFFCVEISALHGNFATRETNKLNQNWYRTMKNANLVTLIVNQEMMQVRSNVERIYWTIIHECIRIKKFMRLSEILTQHELILSRYAEMIL